MTADCLGMVVECPKEEGSESWQAKAQSIMFELSNVVFEWLNENNVDLMKQSGEGIIPLKKDGLTAEELCL